MTVKELIAELNKHDPDMRVEIFSGDWGYVDISEIFESEAISFGIVRPKLNIV